MDVMTCKPVQTRLCIVFAKSMTWCWSGLLSKVLITIILALIVLQYLFGSVVEINKHWDTLFYSNSSRNPSSYILDLNHTRHGILLEMLINSSSMYSLDGSNNTIPYTNNTSENTTSITSCPPIPPELTGKVEIVKSPVPRISDLEKRFKWLKLGGHYTPTECQTNNHVAIIVPYRSRAEQLLLFIQHMHPFLKKQQIEYTIFIVEQNGNEPFNRAMLMNVGFKEALKFNDFQCFIFHDVDLLPEDDRNLYTCPEQPRHMSVSIDIFKYKLPYSTIFGGVSALTKKQFETLNGFSNSFWGWGGEDDDMYNRIKYHNFHISRYPVNIARYTMLTHHKQKANPKRYETLLQGKKKFNADGISNLRYTVVESRANLLYTWMLVNLSKPS